MTGGGNPTTDPVIERRLSTPEPQPPRELLGLVRELKPMILLLMRQMSKRTTSLQPSTDTLWGEVGNLKKKKFRC